MKKIISVFVALALVFTLSVPAFGYSEGYLYYTVSDNSITITGCFGNNETLTVPSEIAGVPVNTIGVGAFADNAYLKTVYLPDTITTIEEGAFAEGITVIYSNNTTESEDRSDNDTDGDKASDGESEETAEEPEKIVISFSDVSEGKYYYNAVIWAVEKGITSGTSATTFSPNATCTRAQIVTFLWRAAGSPIVEAENSFTDVKADDYFYNAVMWAVKMGITSGTSDTIFAPNAACTRAQIVTFLWRAAGSPIVEAENKFDDVKSDAYYYNAVLWAVSTGITSGTSETTFSPNAVCTRGQAVTFIYKAN